MKRILALDGGGIKGLFTLQILRKIEQLFREREENPELVLADVFDLFAGTSTGAVIATCLCWGMGVSEIERLYVEDGPRMFARAPWYQRVFNKYRADTLAATFREIFSEDAPASKPALLGTSNLRALLLVVVRNASTGSAWPVTNNPKAVFNDPALPNCNLNIPLWQLLRASTAAPTYFAPERIRLGDEEFLFVDGGITPYNNPSLLALFTATLPQYQIGWPASRHDLHLISVGTGGDRARLPLETARRITILEHAGYVPRAMLSSVAVQQDMLCRVLGDCLHGDSLDVELGGLEAPSLLASSEQKCTYVRYDQRLDLLGDGTKRGLPFAPRLDDLSLIPRLREIGQRYAEEHVRLEHLDPRA
jgi:hypothetical protein